MTTPALWVAIAAMVPLMLYTMWSDLKHLRIPNWIPLSAVGVFVVTGFLGLPWQTVLWALAAGAAVIVIFFLLYTALDYMGAGGNIGGGDLKLLAALVPFIAWRDAFLVCVIYLISAIVLAVVFVLLWRVHKGESSWASMNQQGRRFRKRTPPMGVSIGATMVTYLAILGSRAMG